MYKPHGWVRPPENVNAPMIRYFPLERFLDLLSSESLYFARLSQFSDAFDGILPKATKSLAKDRFTNLPRNPEDEFTDFEMLVRSNNRINRFYTYASCWYNSKFESDAMWKLYGSGGVAVQSTFARMRDSFAAAKEDVVIGEMTYFDFASFQPPTYGNTMAAPFFKRIECEHEREVRAVTVHQPEDWTHGDLTDDHISRQPLGLKIPAHLELLIEGIILAPGSTHSTSNELREKLSSIGISAPVRKSNLDDIPHLI